MKLINKERLCHLLARALVFVLGSVFLAVSVRAGVDDVISEIEKVEKEEVKVENATYNIKISDLEKSKVNSKIKKEAKESSIFSVSVLGGKSEFPYKSAYLENNFASGVGLGIKLSDALSIEGSFMYSQFKYLQARTGTLIQYDNWQTTVRPAAFNITSQYRTGAEVKYRLWGKSFITPVMGGGMSLMRNSDELVSSQLGQWYFRHDANTSSVAAHGLVGLELNLGGLRIGGIVKGYSTLREVNSDGITTYRSIRSSSDPADLRNHREFVEFLGVVSFDI